MTHEKKACQTELSKYIWRLQRSGAEFEVDWKILDRAASYNNILQRCNLCLTEKIRIVKADKVYAAERKIGNHVEM